MYDGVRQQLDEGVGAHGQRVEVVVGEAEMTEAYENEGERKEAQEVEVDGERIDIEGGHAERTEADQVQEERIKVEEAEVEETDAEKVEVEEAHAERTKADEVNEEGEGNRIEVQEGPVEAERIEAQKGAQEGEGDKLDGEGDRLDGEAYTIEVEDLEDIEVEVRDWSTSRDGDDGEMNSDDGLVDINVQCDVSESFTNLEVEVEPFSPGYESDMEEDEINDLSWFNDELEF
ncbi:midasin-like [Vigna radiata var. radiata]|uniref:Midasin-like n=1 Tax=Vigna radiata var. radiata TaxID=3916 RepID=A0A1S3VUL2_VIGRR|nr:midasin-like [Vigna radiata var. radiata]